jgi:hypothetical protein
VPEGGEEAFEVLHPVNKRTDDENAIMKSRYFIRMDSSFFGKGAKKIAAASLCRPEQQKIPPNARPKWNSR